MSRPAAAMVGTFGALLLGAIATLGIADNREGHAWCDGAAIAVHQPVKACMAAYNDAGGYGVRVWAQPYARALLAAQ